jgi:hypothetical protein
MGGAFATQVRQRPAAPAPREPTGRRGAGATTGTPLFLQTKPVVGPPGDEYEQEADRIADAVVGAGPAPATPPTPTDDNRIQRACAACGTGQTCPKCAAEEEEQIRVQTKADLGGSAPAPPATGGDRAAPLSETTLARIEPVVGADLGGVRVHTGPGAEGMAADLRAKAFTHKNHIWLGAGQSASDLGLVAHEAAHVVQQTADPGGPAPVQRAPRDYQHPEDGGAVSGRMQARINEAIGKPANEPLAGGGPRPARGAREARPGGGAAAENPEAARAAGEIDRGELASKRGELQPAARVDVDRPAAARPQVQEAATTTHSEAEKPAEPLAQAAAGAPTEGALAEGKGKKDKADKKKEGGEAVGAAEAAAGAAEQAFAAAASQPVPTPELPVTPPAPVAPVDAGGMPLPGDPGAEADVADLAGRAQFLREQGHVLRLRATEERGNAETLRGNLELARAGITQAEQGVERSTDHLAFRRELVGKAREGLAVSEQKAAMVAEGAPGFSSKADEGKAESGPMAQESAELSAENAANTPDDPEAAEKAQEQGGQINQAGSDISTTDDAVTRTQAKAGSLQEDAARAQEMNAQTSAKIGAMDETLGQTGEKLAQMGEQSTQARGQVDALADQPDQLAAQAAALDDQGAALVQASFDIEDRLRQTQASYEQGMKSVPAAKPAVGGPDQLVQRQEDTGAAPPADAGAAPAADQLPATGEGRYEDRVNLDLTGAVSGALPSWLTGVDPVSEQQRREAQAAEQERRRSQVAEIDKLAGGHFENLDAADKVGIALRLTGRNLFGSASNIKWPGWGHLALGLIDPRGPLMGVVGGLSMMLSGGANLLSGEQWRRDPLGNLLKSAADIATGLTIILGSITALAGVIIAIMSAITILSFGTAAPITGPVIAFCASVMTTVGGWTIAVGKVALILQALVFIKNLIDAATARTAADLQNQSDQMTQDVSNAGNVVMQIGMAKLAQVGGRQMQAEIAELGGGVGFARNMGRIGGEVGGVALGVEGRGAAGLARNVALAPVRVAVAAGRGLAGVGRGALKTAGQLFSREGRAELASGLRTFGRETWHELTTETPAAFKGRPAFSREFLTGTGEGPAAGGLAEMRTAAQQAAEARAAAGGARPGAPPEPVTPRDAEVLEGTRAKSGSELTPEEILTERRVADRMEPHRINEPPFEEAVELPNGHEAKRTRDGIFCRFTDPECINARGERVSTPTAETPTTAKPAELAPPAEQPPAAVETPTQPTEGGTAPQQATGTVPEEPPAATTPPAPATPRGRAPRLTPEEVAERAELFAAEVRANGGKVPPGVWDRVSPGRTLSEAEKRAIRHYIRDNPDQFPGVSSKPRGMSGPRGDPETTQAQLTEIAERLRSEGWTVQRGADSGVKEEWIPGAGPGRTGGTAVDLTATRTVDGKVQTLRVQTVTTTTPGGVTPIKTEAAAADRIRTAFPDDQLLVIPKKPGK